MRRKCNLELSLTPPNNFSMEDKESEKQSQQLTIFYNGKFVVSDLIELQVKAIIYLASREMEVKINKTSSPVSAEPSSPVLAEPSSPVSSEPSSPLLQPQIYLFMKRSLQRFLQKRKNRIQTTSPYHH